jgi:hypothetical protein
MPKEMVYRIYFLNNLIENAIGPPFPVGSMSKVEKMEKLYSLITLHVGNPRITCKPPSYVFAISLGEFKKEKV